jgi:hypothetical protein
MATRSELYPSRWLSAIDCETPIVATIDRCVIETVGQGVKAERKPVAYFAGNRLKPLIINKTNYDAIVGLTGREDTDEWDGAVVELFAIDVNGPNGPTRGVRVRRPRKPATKSAPRPAAAPEPDQIDEAMPTLEPEAAQ